MNSALIKTDIMVKKDVELILVIETDDKRLNVNQERHTFFSSSPRVDIEMPKS